MPEGKVSVPSTLSGHAAEIYRSAFLGAYEGTCAKPGDRRGGAKVNRDACAAKVAWGAVKEKYKKGKGGKWVARAGDPVVGPISDVPMQTSLPVYGTGMDVHEGETGTKLQRWRRAYIKALRDECRNADQPVECARRKANAAVGFVETDVKPISRSNGRRLTMDQFNDYPLSYVERREFDIAKRNEMAQAGTAMSDGSFPIATGEDVTIALRSLGRTSKPRSGVIAHIRKRAKAIGYEMSPALKRKAATIDRYMERMVLRSQANEVDKQHIHVLADNPIHRPDSVSSEVWRSLPLEQRTVRGEASYRIVERNYAQAVEDAEMNGWRVSRHYYSPDEYYFTKRFSRPGEDKGVLVRAIMVRRVDSVDWNLMAMSDFASSSIARMLPSDIIQHKVNDRSKIPLLKG